MEINKIYNEDCLETLNRKACAERQKRLAAEGNHHSQSRYQFKNYLAERTQEWNKIVLANNEHPFQSEEVKHMVSERIREMNIKNAREGKMYAQSEEGRKRLSELGKNNAGMVTVFDIDGNSSRMTTEEYRIHKQSASSQEEQTYVTSNSREGIRRLSRLKKNRKQPEVLLKNKRGYVDCPCLFLVCEDVW